MSANRAVQAAQRRRAGGPEPAPPGRGPQPSINSSQIFSQQQQQQGQQQQIRPGTNGRLAGQHAQLQQQQQQQQMKQQMSEPKEQGLSSVNKMTLAQAITLITLRLGKVETHLHEQEHAQFSNSGLDNGMIDVIMSRLEALETQSQSSSANSNTATSATTSAATSATTSATSATTSASSLEVNALKQNVELLKSALSQSKSSINVLSHEHKTLRLEVESLKAELVSLQNLAMDNNQQILKLSLAIDLEGDDALNLEDVTDDDNDNLNDNLNDNSNESTSKNEIVGTDLKELIEQELNQ